MKSLKNLGEILSKKEQETVYGGRRPAFLESVCYPTLSQCLAASQASGLGPCVPCTTDWGAPGFKVQAGL